MHPQCHLHRQRLLVIGGGGAVGFAAIQLSVAVGCHVTTTCGSQSIDRLLAAGAEQALDYTAEVFFSLLHPICKLLEIQRTYADSGFDLNYWLGTKPELTCSIYRTLN